MSHKVFRLVSSLFLALAVLGSGLNPQPANAAGPWYVTPTGDDSNDCLSPGSPCATINGALAKPGFVPGDIVRVAIGTYTNTGNEVVLLDKNAILSGGWDSAFTTQSGMSTIDGEEARTGVLINSGIAASIGSFTIQNGNATGNGGGLKNAGTLTIVGSVISNNTAGSGDGSGIYNTGTLTVSNTRINHNGSNQICWTIVNSGHITLNNSTIEDNTTTTIFCLPLTIMNVSGTMILNESTVRNNFGLGIYNYATLTLNNGTVSGNNGGIYNWGGALVLNNTTVSGNTSNDGGGLFTGGEGSVLVNNSTITNNAATSVGGGISNYPNLPSTIIVKNTVLAGNTATDMGPDCSGSLGSSGYNLIGDTSGCTFTPENSDLTEIDPLLGPLQNNGGLTFTHALLPGSPAIDAGNPAGCTDHDGDPLITDQRGVARPQGARCDIGAFELEATGGGGGEVSIDIKPGSQTNPINPKSIGNIPVAILSTADFSAPAEVDKGSLTFGRTGDELSLVSCNKKGADVNSDGLLDLVCHFKTKLTGFQIGDTEGFLKGQTLEGASIEGSDAVRVLK